MKRLDLARALRMLGFARSAEDTLMRVPGTVQKVGRYWAIEVPALGVATQGRSRADAFAMVADAVQALVNRPGFDVRVFPRGENDFELSTTNVSALIALLLRRHRAVHGITLAAAAQRLGATSPNTYARYEKGRAQPSLEQLERLLAAVEPGAELVVTLAGRPG